MNMPVPLFALALGGCALGTGREGVFRCNSVIFFAGVALDTLNCFRGHGRFTALGRLGIFGHLIILCKRFLGKGVGFHQARLTFNPV